MKQYKLLKDLPMKYKAGIILSEEQWCAYFNYHSISELILHEKEWFKEITPILYTEDFKDGKFPVKSCSNCIYPNIKLFGCNSDGTSKDISCLSWKGVVVGQPIYEGDTIYLADSFQVLEIKNIVSGFDIKPTDPKGKFFSNKENAEKYYCELVTKKRGIEIGTELFDDKKKYIGKVTLIRLEILTTDKVVIEHTITNSYNTCGIGLDYVLTFAELAKKEEGLTVGMEINSDLLIAYTNSLNLGYGFSESCYISKFIIHNGKINAFVNNKPCFRIHGADLPIIGFKKFKEEWEAKQVTPEQQANKLGFKIGDKYWDTDGNYYFGKLLRYRIDGSGNFVTHWENSLEEFTQGCTPDTLTNKVAIHTPTKEEFEFIVNKIDPTQQYKWSSGSVKTSNYSYVTLNDLGKSHEFIQSHYLIVSVDEYMKSIGEKPSFIAEDSKPIWNGLGAWSVCLKTYTEDDDTWEKGTIHLNCRAGTPDYTVWKPFSTKQAAEDYLDSIKIPKYVRWIGNLGSGRNGLMSNFFQKGKIFNTDEKQPVLFVCSSWKETLSKKWYSYNFEEVTEEEYLESLKPKLEWNNWYRLKDHDSKYPYLVYLHKKGKYGFNGMGEWFENNNIAKLDDKWELATEATVIKRLEKYAKTHYTEGVMFKSTITDNGLIRVVRPYDSISKITWKICPFYKDKESLSIRAYDGLYSNNGGCSNPVIYRDGKWAEIAINNIKVGDWIIVNFIGGNIKHRGQIAKVLSNDSYQHLDGTIEWNSFNFEGCRLATQEEIDKITKLTLGNLPLTISKTKILVKDRGSVTIEGWIKWYNSYIDNPAYFLSAITEFESYLGNYKCILHPGTEDDNSIGCIHSVSWTEIHKLNTYIRELK